MFTGIIETMGEVKHIEKDGSNVHFTFSSALTHELQIDQSVAHNGICLTVVALNGDEYTVTAIDETLQKTNLGDLQKGQRVNLERCTKIGGRLDGHIVQGHVDQTALCTAAEDHNGSWKYYFRYTPDANHITVEKGSICINGVSLTVVDSKDDLFSVAIIPYTRENTTFKYLKEGDRVNLEFDIIGKYVSRIMGLQAKTQ
ncbi:MAG: riboflavin synthase [Owenweeksia sp.]